MTSEPAKDARDAEDRLKRGIAWPLFAAILVALGALLHLVARVATRRTAS